MSRYDDFTTFLTEVAASRKSSGRLDKRWLAAATRAAGSLVATNIAVRVGLVGGALAGFGVAFLGPVGLLAAGALAGVKLYQSLAAGEDEGAISLEAARIEDADRLHAELRQLATDDPEGARRQIDRLFDRLTAATPDDVDPG